MEALAQQLLRQAIHDEELNSRDSRPRPSHNRQNYIARWQNKQLVSWMSEMGVGGQAGKQMIITGKSHTSTLPLDALHPIKLAKMRVPLVHAGHYLVCRVISEAIVEVGTTVLIEDLTGDVEELILFNFQYDLSNTTWLPKGTIMLIKEPYLKYLARGVQIRVDSPSDVVFVDEADEQNLLAYGAQKWYVPLKLTYEQLRQKGNDSFAAKNYEYALKWYNQALFLQPNSPVMYLNKAACLLEVGKHYEAYQEAGRALNAGADKKKALYRLGKAAYGMCEWQLAIDHFQRIHKDYPADKEVSDQLGRAKARLNESQTGNYNIHELYKLAILQHQRCMDVADYVGPVEIVDIEGKGKGLVVTRDVQKGTLLLVSKPFCMAFEDDLSAPLCSFNAFEIILGQKKQALCIISAIQMLRKNPHKANDLYALFAGDLPRDIDIPQGVVDTARIEKICTYNRIILEPKFDVSQVVDDLIRQEVDWGVGIWLLPSFINHSCLATALHFFYGDTMFVYAIQDLKKGEEVTIRYVNSFASYEDRAKRLAHPRNIVCQCRLCQLDQEDPFYEQKEKLKIECIAMATFLFPIVPRRAFKTINSTLPQLRASYGHRQELKTQLISALIDIATFFIKFGKHKEAIQLLKEADECVGEEFWHIYGVFIRINIAYCYLALKQMALAKQYALQAVAMNKLRLGWDATLFKMLFPESRKILE